ncbi:MAG: hypothetical protein RLN88_13370 [Ekhidna sp.]|uniref:TolB family protein n=1 Tax=Ekhidna sp. TaxID=2608089 RepID=UPI0032ED8323
MRVSWFLFIAYCYAGCSNTHALNDAMVIGLSSLSIGNGLSFHPVENLILISKPGAQMDKASGKPIYQIYSSCWKGGKWTEPELVSFNDDFHSYHPVFSPDGQWIYFNSNRPVPGESTRSEKVNIWRVSYSEGGWGTPEFLEDINTASHESYPSLASNGDLYFNSDRPGGSGSMDIYVARMRGDGFGPPEPIEILNSADSENDLAVDPEGRFLIFNRYHFNDGEISLFISYKENEGWSPPQLMGKINQPNVWELTPTLSPNGDCLFYEVDGRINSYMLHHR